tara:strand:- start:3311 stop:3556 length:246 start_codon:yes stop_codon:yes gene_type:complete
MKQEISLNLFTAALKELEAKEAKAVATINLYLNGAVGIADHSQVVDEIAKWSSIGAEALDSKKFLLSKFTTVKEDTSKESD